MSWEILIFIMQGVLLLLIGVVIRNQCECAKFFNDIADCLERIERR